MMSDANKAAVNDKSIDTAEDTIEAVIEDSAGIDASKSKKHAPSKRSKGGLFFIILLIAAGVGGLHMSGQLQPLYELAKASMARLQADQIQNDQTQTAQLETEQSQVAQSQRGRFQIDRFSTVQKAVPQSDLMSKQVQTQLPSMPDVNSEEVRVLLSTMHQLRMEMHQLESSQRIWQDTLLEQQQMNTQVRLRWIADPASRLPQMQLAWEEISLLPGLSDQQRQQAVDMHALARSNVQHLKQWQGELQKWADALVTPIHHNIIPQPQQPWLAWIVGQFQLRQAPTQEAQHLADLRGRLLDSARQLSLESWPAQSAWQRLHAELLLQIKAMQAPQEQNAEVAIDTGLPTDFSGIAQDIITLRQAARAWEHDVQEGEVL